MNYQSIRRPVVILSALLFHVLLIFHLLFSPVIIVIASQKGIVNASFVVFVLLSGLSLFFGRAYCSWFCPGCGVQEIMAFFMKRKAKSNKANSIKYIIFIIWIGAIFYGYMTNGIQRIDLTYGMSDISVQRKIILTLGAIVIIVPITALFGRFASCKYICWQAPFMIIGTSIRDYFHLRGLRLKADQNKCIGCELCTTKCPMNIEVMAKVETGKMANPECILCGNCVDNCKKKAIRFSFSKN